MILAIVQARMSSTRFPGKVLEPILGEPMLGRQIMRIRRWKRIDRLIVATSDQSSDDSIADFGARSGIACYRGALLDVLDRFYAAAKAFGPAEHIVRLTADCPLADWQVIDDCIALHLADGADYSSNALQRSFPDGLDVEVFRMVVLERMWRDACESDEREHVTLYVGRHPDLFRIAHHRQAKDLSSLRWTVDTPADLAMVRAIYAALLAEKPEFRQDDILALLHERPDIVALNAPEGHCPSLR